MHSQVCPTRMLNKRPDTVKKFCTNWLLSWDNTENTPGSFQRLANDKAKPGNTSVATIPAKTLGNPTRNNVRIWTRWLRKSRSLCKERPWCRTNASRIPPAPPDGVSFFALLSYCIFTSLLLLLLSYVDRTFVPSRPGVRFLEKHLGGCTLVKAWKIEERNATAVKDASHRRIVTNKTRSILEIDILQPTIGSTQIVRSWMIGLWIGSIDRRTNGLKSFWVIFLQYKVW
jgi:hypothetical protein